MRSKVRAYSHQGHGPRADQQAGYISATSDRTSSLANSSRSIHIEPGWSKLKSVLRTAEARTRETLEAALVPALDSITPADARGWFNHCGYSFPD